MNPDPENRRKKKNLQKQGKKERKKIRRAWNGWAGSDLNGD